VLDLTEVEEIKSARQVMPANTLEGQILEKLDFEPIHVDEICQVVGLPVAQVSAALTMMELKGLVQHVGGMRYAAVREMKSR
jgi:DNA processing protein